MCVQWRVLLTFTTSPAIKLHAWAYIHSLVADSEILMFLQLPLEQKVWVQAGLHLGGKAKGGTCLSPPPTPLELAWSPANFSTVNFNFCPLLTIFPSKRTPGFNASLENRLTGFRMHNEYTHHKVVRILQICIIFSLGVYNCGTTIVTQQ